MNGFKELYFVLLCLKVVAIVLCNFIASVFIVNYIFLLLMPVTVEYYY